MPGKGTKKARVLEVQISPALAAEVRAKLDLVIFLGEVIGKLYDDGSLNAKDIVNLGRLGKSEKDVFRSDLAKILQRYSGHGEN